MTQQENCVRVTRAAKKRAACPISSYQSLPPTKKRAVLGELTNVTAIPVPAPGPQKPNTRLKKGVESNLDDPQMCVPYASDIYEYLQAKEKMRRPLPNYLEKIQKDITCNMRGTLVDWLVEVLGEYRLLPETLYLTVAYIDRYLSLNPLNRQRLQLLGVSCMLIAAKYEEISPPHVEDFCYITDYTYTKQEVVQMEAEILQFLKFEMGNPTIKSFLEPFTRVAQENCRSPKLEFLACYLAELSLLDSFFVRFLPSLVAASVIFVAKFTLQPKVHPWTENLQRQTGYRPIDLRECVDAIQGLQLGNSGRSLVSIRQKYKQQRFKCVATLRSQINIPSEYFEDVQS